MSITEDFINYDALRYVLQMATTDLKCYGECFHNENGVLQFQEFSNVPETHPKFNQIRDFAITADSEKYMADIGLVGVSSTETSYHVRNLQELLQDQFFFNNGGTRFAVSAEIFTTAITIPIRERPWNPDSESIQWRSLTMGSCLRYRRTGLLGVVVLYFERPPKFLGELRRYLDTVVRCSTPLIDLMADRARYARVTFRGGSKYRRARRALASMVRTQKKTVASSTDTLSRPISPSVDSNMTETRATSASDPSDLSDPGSDLESGFTGNAVSFETVTSVLPEKTSPATQLELLMHAQVALITAYMRKWQGGAPNPPARLDTRTCAIAFVGCFVTIATWQVLIDRLNHGFTYGDLTSPLSLPSSFGALSTIVFALPAAPLAQPRVFVLAHTWAILVGTVMMLVWVPYQLVWLQKAVALAITVTGMGQFGIINPPASAICLAMVAYANSSEFSLDGWLFLVVSTYLGCALCIAVGVLWHNAFTGRVYPLYW